jgi:hypothetical protein
MANIQSDDRLNNEQPQTEPPTQVREEAKTDEDDFKITVKKLDKLVRPRGVLADG